MYDVTDGVILESVHYRSVLEEDRNTVCARTKGRGKSYHNAGIKDSHCDWALSIRGRSIQGNLEGVGVIAEYL